MERVKKLCLKYLVGYASPQRYWNARWRLGCTAEQQTDVEARREFTTILDLMLGYRCKNVLEVGCGQAALRALPGYLGLDFSLEALQQSGLDTFLYADISDRIPLPDDCMDAVLCRYVLLHIKPEHIDRAVGELCRVAKTLILLKEPQGPTDQLHCFHHNLTVRFRRFHGSVEYLAR